MPGRKKSKAKSRKPRRKKTKTKTKSRKKRSRKKKSKTKSRKKKSRKKKSKTKSKRKKKTKTKTKKRAGKSASGKCYCMSCRKKVDCTSGKIVARYNSKRGKNIKMLMGKCSKCGGKVCKIVA